jgi:hypothetical protein
VILAFAPLDGVDDAAVVVSDAVEVFRISELLDSVRGANFPLASEHDERSGVGQVCQVI